MLIVNQKNALKHQLPLIKTRFSFKDFFSGQFLKIFQLLNLLDLII